MFVSFSLPVLGDLLAFLLYNWPAAKISMADCASGFLGFTLAALPLLHSTQTGTDLWQSINLSALMLFPFLFDGTYTIFRSNHDLPPRLRPSHPLKKIP